MPDLTMTDRLAEFARRAEGEGLLDVAYAEVESPLGPMLAATTPRGVVRLRWEDGGADDILAELARSVSPRILEAPARLDPLRRELDEYFAGRRREFTVPVDMTLARSPFRRRALGAIARIPYGEVDTYRHIAGRAGNARAVRAAGSACGSNPVCVVVPCHRVLRSDGTLGGYGGGLDRKRFLLGLEGVLDAA